MSIQKYIQKYIILKIEANEYKHNTIIPSENKFAMKFKCSRLTARHALQKMVFSGILSVVKGKGYMVNNYAERGHLKSWSKEHKISRTELEKIENVDSEIKKYLEINDEKIIAFIKRYYDDKKLISVQYTVLNKNIIWEKNYEGFRESITNELIKQNIFIEKNRYIINFSKPPKCLKIYIDKLGYEDKPLIERSESTSSLGWIEKTIRIIDKDKFMITLEKNKFD